MGKKVGNYAKRFRQRFSQQIERADAIRNGSQGAASGVRRISPIGYVALTRKLVVPKSLEEIAREQRELLARRASRLTGIKRV